MFYGKPRFVLNTGSLLSSWDNLNSFCIVFWALIRHIQYFFEREKELTGKPRNTQGKHSPRSRRTSLGFSARNLRALEKHRCELQCEMPVLQRHRLVYVFKRNEACTWGINFLCDLGQELPNLTMPHDPQLGTEILSCELKTSSTSKVG